MVQQPFGMGLEPNFGELPDGSALSKENGKQLADEGYCSLDNTVSRRLMRGHVHFTGQLPLHGASDNRKDRLGTECLGKGLTRCGASPTSSD